MILRRHTSSLWSFLLLTLLFSTCASAAEDDANPFDCHLTVDSVKYDLTSLKGEKSIERTRESPPGKIKDKIFFNLCENFKPKDTLKEHCPEGTRFCFTKTFFQGDKDGVLIAVIPIAESSLLKPESSALSSSEKGLSITLHGPVSKASGHAQSVNLEMLCVKEDDKQDKPEFKSYDGEVLKLSWKSPAACATHDDKKTDPPPGDGEQKPGDSKGDEVGSGVGWFFLMLILAFLAYMGLGAYYNYSTYGATGSDLIPHRDFWREVPYMMRDVVGHLCSSVRPTRQSRGGYVSV